jgi:hypothetical protein
MYLGMAIILFGVKIWSGSPLGLLMVLAFALYITHPCRPSKSVGGDKYFGFGRRCFLKSACFNGLRHSNYCVAGSLGGRLY